MHRAYPFGSQYLPFISSNSMKFQWQLKMQWATVFYANHSLDGATNAVFMGAQWLSGRVLDLRPKGCGFEPHRCHCVVSLSKNINPSLVEAQPRKTHRYITER